LHHRRRGTWSRAALRAPTVTALAAWLLVLPFALEGQEPPASPETLRPGDAIRIQVWRQPEFSGEFAVTDQGVIAHPILRQVTVTDIPVREAEESVRRVLTMYESDPNLVVEPFFRIAVGGEVRAPNVHLLRPGTTVAEAVAAAGGHTERSALHRVILRRGNADYRIDLTDPALSLPHITVRSGDQIMVERDRSIFREYVLPTISVAGSLASIYRIFR